MTDLIPFGISLPDLDPTRLSTEIARRTLATCSLGTSFDVIELRRHNDADVIVVDCVNDQVPSRNRVGVMVREPLALVFPHDVDKAPEVRALRADFPIVAHLNHVPAGEPVSLCLNTEKWERLRRTWTPQKHLQRILWWLTETSKESLHRPDQPLEQIYFDSGIELVLPPDFEERAEKEANSLALTAVERPRGSRTFRANFERGPPNGEAPTVLPIVLTLGPVVHGMIERHPGTLGTLSDQLLARGASLSDPLSTAVRSRIPSAGIMDVPKQVCLLVLNVLLQRDKEGRAERHERRGFVLLASLAHLGDAMGILHREGMRYYAPSLIGGNGGKPQSTTWRSVPLQLVDVKSAATIDFARRASGVPAEGASQRRVLAGVGALGSALADLWAREGWGEWILVDPDHVQPHNVIRHVARDPDVGFQKSDVVKVLTDGIYQTGHRSATSLPTSILASANAMLDEALEDAALIVDATTTLEVPRDLSQRTVARVGSVFVTPSGADSALLLEDAHRAVRLDSLEAQYYSAILGADWGATHLVGHAGVLAVGAGCRDISVVMSAEMIQFHAAILARQMRQLSTEKEARIRVWRAESYGEVQLFDTPVSAPRISTVGGWRVVSNERIETRVVSLRHEHLPAETGGVILGYVDHQMKSIFIVDFLPAPPDSAEEESGFIRGVSGLEESVNQAGARTAAIVGYIGEWHSHPPFHPATPSNDDKLLMKHLSDVLMRDGEPALMVIVGSANELSFSVRDAG